MIKNKTAVMVMALALVCTVGAQAQRVTAMRLNEVLVVNQDNFLDDYGKRSGWIELFNSSAGTVNIAGCYLTNDPSNHRKYPIPKGDVLTKIPPGQHVLFWIDGSADKGTFHVNFVLDPSKENYLALYDADGTTLVDEVRIPAGQQPDVSFGRPVDGKAEWMQLTKVTPSTNNLTLDKNDKIDKFKKNDAVGVGMTLTAMLVVFLGLLVLYLSFKSVGKIAMRMSRQRAQKAGVTDVPTHGIAEEGGVFAAIATALYEVTEDVHDIESTVLTIHKVTRRYSPWSSKIHSMREFNR
ncbi:MAG: lamin tail domain-containing protein [Tannerella sp.]|jgi:hypothetical protein|nr:lamin tail domain-containing protein [Tannerella sp.]